MIRLNRPTLGDEEAQAVAEVLSTGMLVQGERVAAFEARVAERCGRSHGVAVSSGTAALEVALAALGVGPGDEVLVPDVTWPSPAHAVRLRGARPVLVDVDPLEWNPRAEAFAGAQTPRTRAAIVIDQFGFPARHAEIAAALPGVAVIEDAACAIGSTVTDRPCGSFGAIACLSFHPRKIVTTGEGGMCLTDDPALAERLRVLRNHGQASPGKFVEPAGNLRMTEIAAAVGLVQLDRLDRIVAARRHLAARYRAALPEATFQEPGPSAEPNYQTFGLLLPEGVDRDQVIAGLRADGIEAGLLSHALHRLPSVGAESLAAFPHAEAVVDRGIALPLHPEITEPDQDRIVASVRSRLRPGP